MRYGYFDEIRKEYVITRPDTPTPWINYIGSGNYGGIISNTGGGYSFHKDPQNRRITRYRYNSIPMDRPGRYVYVRDEATGEYWNPGYQPSQTKLDYYSCRHGLGYTVLEGEYKGIVCSETCFVPDDKDFEIWLVKVKNQSSATRRLKVFGYTEFCFWDAILDQQNVDWAQQINQGRYQDGIITWYPHHKPSQASFFATSGEVDSFDTNLETFIGKYHSEANPIAVEQGTCSNSISYRMNGVGALCVPITLQKGEEYEIVFILGYSENRKEVGLQIEGYRTPEKAHAAFERLSVYWNTYLSHLSVQTPDHEMNLFINTWNQYQCKTTFNWSRFVSLYQLGLGRGMGIRDSAQDTLGVMHTIPEEAKQLIIKLVKCQYTDGRVYHLFFPLTGEGGLGDAPVKKFDWYSDDHLWLILAVNAYVKESGDFAFLEEQIPYNDQTTTGTVLEHLRKAMEFTSTHCGPNGIALAGRADWNDTLNLDQGKGIAESVFTSMLYCRTALEMSELFHFLGDKDEASRWIEQYNTMKNAINQNCWDGEWYKRAFDDNGAPLGSKENEYGKIFINSQSWAVLGKVAEGERQKLCLDSVHQHLNTKYGIVAMYPAYTAYDDSKGGITTFPPGTKENGGIFLHTNPWMMIAEVMSDNPERAFQYYKQIIPAARNDDADLLEVEPYVYSQNILGKEHPQHGIGRNSWLTGTASWNLVAASQYILGIRAHYDQLVVDPCIPPSWEGFNAKRIFRGATYQIEVKNASKTGKGVKKLLVDGMEAAVVPVFEKGSTHTVTVIL